MRRLKLLDLGNGPSMEAFAAIHFLDSQSRVAIGKIVLHCPSEHRRQILHQVISSTSGLAQLVADLDDVLLFEQLEGGCRLLRLSIKRLDDRNVSWLDLRNIQAGAGDLGIERLCAWRLPKPDLRATRCAKIVASLLCPEVAIK